MWKKQVSVRMLVMALILMVAMFVLGNLYIMRAHAQDKPVPQPEIQGQKVEAQAPAKPVAKPAVKAKAKASAAKPEASPAKK